MRDEYGQPTIETLHRALIVAMEVENHASAAKETLENLLALRKAKVIWQGREEASFRLVVDCYLRYRGIVAENESYDRSMEGRLRQN